MQSCRGDAIRGSAYLRVCLSTEADNAALKVEYLPRIILPTSSSVACFVRRHQLIGHSNAKAKGSHRDQQRSSVSLYRDSSTSAQDLAHAG